jgi:hypothetical protein
MSVMVLIHDAIKSSGGTEGDRLCGLVVRVPGYRSRFPALPDFLRSNGSGTGCTHKGMVRSDMSKPALIFFSLQEYTQQNPLSKF